MARRHSLDPHGFPLTQTTSAEHPGWLESQRTDRGEWHEEEGVLCAEGFLRSQGRRKRPLSMSRCANEPVLQTRRAQCRLAVSTGERCQNYPRICFKDIRSAGTLTLGT